jgi:small subunit ribosomal protein S6
MQKYEIAVLYHPDLEVDLAKGEERFKKIISENKGKIISSDNWGKKKLAYPIADNEHAVYVFYMAELDTQTVTKIEGLLNITDEIMRYLIARIDQKEIAKAERAKKAAEKRSASRTTDDEKAEPDED